MSEDLNSTGAQRSIVCTIQYDNANNLMLEFTNETRRKKTGQVEIFCVVGSEQPNGPARCPAGPAVACGSNG